MTVTGPVTGHAGWLWQATQSAALNPSQVDKWEPSGQGHMKTRHRQDKGNCQVVPLMLWSPVDCGLHCVCSSWGLWLHLRQQAECCYQCCCAPMYGGPMLPCTAILNLHPAKAGLKGGDSSAHVPAAVLLRQLMALQLHGCAARAGPQGAGPQGALAGSYRRGAQPLHRTACRDPES
jgi:hypothetical protein